jgi:hypothetical protein
VGQHLVDLVVHERQNGTASNETKVVAGPCIPAMQFAKLWCIGLLELTVSAHVRDIQDRYRALWRGHAQPNVGQRLIRRAAGRDRCFEIKRDGVLRRIG